MFQTVACNLGVGLSPQHHGLNSAVSAGHQSTDSQTGSDKLATVLPGLSLSARFAFAAAVVLCNGMALLGGWVATQIEKGLSQNAAISESVYVQSLLAPIVPLLASQEKDARQIADAVDRILQPTPLWNRLKSVAIWLPDGSVVYSTDKGFMGRHYTLPSEIRDAFKDEVRTTLLDRRSRLLYPDKSHGGTLRIVYTPLHEKDNGKVIAVMEITSDADALEAQLDSIRKRTWIVVGIATLLMIGLLFGIVHSGSKKIEEQRSEIERRLDEEIRLGQLNKDLRERLQEANQRGIELGEEQLRRISSDLENGPVQLLALALLRMYELKPATDPNETASPHSVTEVVDVITRATTGAMRELREIASGLLLPELQRLSSGEALERAIRVHEQTTDTFVERNISSFPDDLPLPVTICIFRVVQEGLMNAYCHAGARGQSVTATREADGAVAVAVSDDGPGFSAEEVLKPGSGLGLLWLKQRVESIGGTLTIRSAEEAGTRLMARFPYAASSPSDGDTTA